MIPCSTANLICALVGLDPRKRLIGLCSGALKALPRSLANFMRARVIGARRYDHTSCWSGVNTNVITFSKTHTAASWENTGTTRSSPPGGYSDKNTYHCVGLTASFDGKVTVTGVCETKDADRDKRLGHYLFVDGKETFYTVVAGTGKYEGMSLTSTVEQLGPFPAIKNGTFQGWNHPTGAYKLK
jgi:hypothetical protein